MFLLVHENYGGSLGGVLAQDLQQFEELPVLVDYVDLLTDVRTDDGSPANRHLGGLVQDPSRQGLHGSSKSGKLESSKDTEK